MLRFVLVCLHICGYVVQLVSSSFPNVIYMYFLPFHACCLALPTDYDMLPKI